MQFKASVVFQHHFNFDKIYFDTDRVEDCLILVSRLDKVRKNCSMFENGRRLLS